MFKVRLSHFAAIAAALALGACGGGTPKKTAEAKQDKTGIFISTNDCAAAEIVSADKCGEAVDLALKKHESEITAYPTKGQCDKAEGAERCARSADGKYRVRLQAFMITLGDKPVGEPLYPPPANTVGFKDAKKTTIEALDDTRIVSAAALAIAHDNARLP